MCQSGGSAIPGAAAEAGSSAVPLPHQGLQRPSARVQHFRGNASELSFECTIKGGAGNEGARHIEDRLGIRVRDYEHIAQVN